MSNNYFIASKFLQFPLIRQRTPNSRGYPKNPEYFKHELNKSPFFYDLC